MSRNNTTNRKSLYRTIKWASIALAAACASIPAPAAGQQAGEATPEATPPGDRFTLMGDEFTVRRVNAVPGEQLDHLSEAMELLTGARPNAGDTRAAYGVINFADPDNSEHGHFVNDVPFLGDAPELDDQNFAVWVGATVTIPEAGEYTFGVNSDDGFALRVGDFGFGVLNPRSPQDTLGTFDFKQAGEYRLMLTYFEQVGGAELELFAAKGRFGTFEEGQDNFRLVGDTANGGLPVATPTPEPGALALLALTGVFTLRRRGA